MCDRSQKYYSLFEQTNDAVFILSLEGVHLELNQRASQMLGYPKEEIISLSYSDLSAEGGESKEVLKKILNGENVPVYERMFRKKNGELIPVEINVQLVRDEEGNPAYIQSVVRDISQRKDAEKALQEKQRELDNYFTSSLDLLCIGNTRGEFIRLNKEWENVLGYTLDELQGASFLNYVHPDDVEATQKTISQLSQNKNVTGFVNRYQCKNGSYRWFEWACNNLGETIYAVARDITDRKEMEQNLAERDRLLTKLSHQVPGAIYQYQSFPDGSSCFPFASEGIWDIYEVTPEEVKTDASKVFSRIHPEDYNRVVNGIRLSHENLIIWEDEYRVVLPKKGERWLRGLARPELQQDGSVLWYGYLTDITDRKQMEISLKIAKEDAESANSSKTMFLANMSHEIRTPMNGLLGFLYLLTQTNLNEEQQEYVTIIKESADTLLNIINEILDISKIEAGKMTLSNHPFDLYNVIKESVQTFKLKAKEKNITLQSILSDDTPKMIVGDSIKLKQIIMNLLGNSVKFTDIGSITLETKINSFEENNYEICFTVTDTGIGMKEQDLNKIFKPYGQTENHLTKIHIGTGLGLAICKALVEMMGGNIKFESVEGKGTKVTFTVIVGKPKNLEEHPIL